MEHCFDTTLLRDLTMSDPNAISFAIMRPHVESNNFQFNPTVITFYFYKINMEGIPWKTLIITEPLSHRNVISSR